MKLKTILIWLTVFYVEVSHSIDPITNQTMDSGKEMKILSRRKRFLVFPTGSSFSVAVCMTIGVYGNPQFSLFSWALNYGFAYNLPTNSTYFTNPPLEKQEKPEEVAEDEKKEDPPEDVTKIFSDDHDHDHDHHHHHDTESGGFGDMVSNMNPFSMSVPDVIKAIMPLPAALTAVVPPVVPPVVPAVVKRKMDSYKPMNYETRPMMQRRYRREIYNNMEVAIDRMGYNGRECILRALCESSQVFSKKKRNMIEEMIKTAFSFPKSKVLSFEHPELLIYDEAHRKGNKKVQCTTAYPKCQFSLLQLALGKYSKPLLNYM
ncbi:unnamed protein product [Diamesa serratosioi]